jgi:hypothetical protein
MEKTIWKWAIGLGETTVKIPVGAELLTIQEQYGEPCLWALVDPSAEKEERFFRTYGSGHPVKDVPGKYVGTFQLKNGSFVFHVFEEM